jgi:hypothetical protein
VVGFGSVAFVYAGASLLVVYGAISGWVTGYEVRVWLAKAPLGYRMAVAYPYDHSDGNTADPTWGVSSTGWGYLEVVNASGELVGRSVVQEIAPS